MFELVQATAASAIGIMSVPWLIGQFKRHRTWQPGPSYTGPRERIRGCVSGSRQLQSSHSPCCKQQPEHAALAAYLDPASPPDSKSTN